MTPVQWVLATVAFLMAAGAALYLAALAYDEWLHRREQALARSAQEAAARAARDAARADRGKP